MKKKTLIPIIITAVVILAIVLVLAKNKKSIDESNITVNRNEFPVSVNVAKVIAGTLDINAQYPALLKPVDEANLTSQSSGIIASLNLELGQHVRKGEIIGKLDTRILEINLKTAEVNLKSAEINRQKLNADYKRAKDLYEHNAGLETTMINAKNSLDNAHVTYDNAVNQINLTKQQIANANIISPLSGTISAKNVKFGEFVNPGTPIAVITNVNSIKTTAFVDQNIIYKLKLGQQGIIASSLFIQKELFGKIIFISPKADANHNYQVDLLVQNTQGIALKAGTDVNLKFTTGLLSKAIQIPKISIIQDRQEPFVYVVENNIAKERTIKIGASKNNYVEVIEGLTEGEIVVTNGQINLREGSIVNIVK